MFTGIVEELGSVTVLASAGGDVTALEVACSRVLADARIGDSISVNGCCLTVTALLEDEAGAPVGFRTELMGETLARTALGGLAPGAAVNLEPALRADARLGGHLVQGHVDAVAEVLALEERGGWAELRCSLPPAVAPYVVEKGSITVQGTSLTVMAVTDRTFSIGVIPHTMAVTVLGSLQPGDRVNLEADVVAKYVERLLAGGAATPYTPPSAAGPGSGGAAGTDPSPRER